MIIENGNDALRPLKSEEIQCDLVVVGGGLAGTCAAITAAREGVRVTLVQDRPVLGGNGSSEVRLWCLGATSHMGNNNRWSREGGLVDEILVENIFRNKEGNPIIFDTVLLEKVLNEPNIRLLLNTSVYEVKKSGGACISEVMAFCSQNSTRYTMKAPLFCDASGDGIVAFQAGAAFRMGAESSEEFGELFAPDQGYGELLGHTIYFYSKDVGHPVKYVAPDFALKDITQIPRYKSIDVKDSGCKFWWIEYGGRLDTIHETEAIKYELWKIVYGVWDYIKNSGKFPEAETMTLEWVGTIPGKRESRRFEGPYMIIQQDVIEQREHPDAVAAGGWSLDLHPADAIYSERPACNQWHSKGVYQIPYRCYFSRNIENLFLAGRIISASHVAFGSSRVILTCGHGGAAVGMAAALCNEQGVQPADILKDGRMQTLQSRLNKEGQSIPGIPAAGDGNLCVNAKVEASSILELAQIPANGKWLPLEFPVAQLLPFHAFYTPRITFTVRSEKAAALKVALRTSLNPINCTPDETLEEIDFELDHGEQEVEVRFTQCIGERKYAFICLYGDDTIEVRTSQFRCTGIVSVQKKHNHAVSNTGEQVPPPGLGLNRFEFWVPNRRPDGENLALHVDPALPAFAPSNITNGYTKPFIQSNAWVADPTDPEPALTLNWDEPQDIGSIYLYFDTDYDHAMESAQWGHPEDVMPFCVRNYKILDDAGNILHSVKDNYQTINRIRFDKPMRTAQLTLVLEHPSKNVPAAIFEVRCFKA